MDGKERHEKPKNPRASANIFSALTMSWALPICWVGYQRDLEIEDLFVPLDEHTSSMLGDKISDLWQKELKNSSAGDDKSKKNVKEGKGAAKKQKDPSLLRVILRCFGAETMLYGIAMGIPQIAAGVTQPLLLGRLLQSYSSNDSSDIVPTEVWLYAMGIVLCSFLKALAMNPGNMGLRHVSMKMRVACCTLVYRKALKLSQTALGGAALGQTVNLISNDVNRFDTSMSFLQYLWIGPVQIVIATYLMYTEVGIASLFGTCSLLLFLPLQAFLAKWSTIYRQRVARRTDERVRLTNEIVTGIQAIKMYTWEQPFSDLVQLARNFEVAAIRGASIIRGIVLSFFVFVPRFCLFITLIGYIFLGNDVTADKVFMLTAYFNILQETMSIYFPQALTQGGETLVSIRRLKTFLLKEESEEILSIGSNKEANQQNVIGSIKLTNATTKWTTNAENNTLDKINIDIEPGQLIAIVGGVGSGKSSLLHVILRELPLNTGKVEVSGKLSYASQDPWLFAESIRQNILFGSEMNPRRYEQVVKVCQLKRDFSLFPYGDRTIVGDRGVSLSGGQRARINLARAIYANADIYLLDDPLSAVDTHVGKHMFDECIAGYLKEKTRVLVTHQLQHLKNVDRIIVLKDGAVQLQGTWQELQKSGVDIARLLETPEEEKPSTQRQLSRTVSRVGSIKSRSSADEPSEQAEPTEVLETRSKGVVTSQVYLDYLRAGGHWCVLILVAVLVVLTQVLASGSDYFISFWVNLEERHPSTEDGERVEWDSFLSREICMYIYSGLVIGIVSFTLIRSISCYNYCMQASRKLHDTMFRGISRATMRFFNTNSTGRILNRFSKDLGTVDETLPSALIDFVQVSLTLVGALTIVSISNYWLVIPAIASGILLQLFRSVYLRTSRSVKRLEGVTRSPVVAHLSATLQGLTTIRAFQAAEILTKEFDHHQDLHSSAWFIFIGTTRVFVFWMDMISTLYIALVTFSFFVIPGLTSTGGNIGLAITQSMSLTVIFQWGMRQSAELENQMTSVERVLEYSVVDQEPPLESSPENKPDPSWPTEGQVEFKELSLQYDPNDPPVLKNLNFVIEPRHKVGIVGRTGAGKSSLISALFRLSYLDGDITIDGIASGKLGLHDLRSKISIIPQEPFLFSGTMRRNLDPFNEYPDSLLWQALEEVELKDMKLDWEITEGGLNLSIGQRQLVCLARAILRNNRILVLDEATANVDLMTDELIQRTIRDKFTNCTVLTIAHRLNTVMDSNKVLVMDAGMVVEYDHPHILLQNEKGYLRGMVDQTGKSMAESLALIAKNNYLSQGSDTVIVDRPKVA